jgi:hypothetical protein
MDRAHLQRMSGHAPFLSGPSRPQRKLSACGERQVDPATRSFGRAAANDWYGHPRGDAAGATDREQEAHENQRTFDLCSIYPCRTDIEVCGPASLNFPPFQYFASYSPNRRSHEVRRISARRNRFHASRRRSQCSARPAKPFEKTGKYHAASTQRTFSLGQVAEGTGLGSNVLQLVTY